MAEFQPRYTHIPCLFLPRNTDGNNSAVSTCLKLAMPFHLQYQAPHIQYSRHPLVDAYSTVYTVPTTIFQVHTRRSQYNTQFYASSLSTPTRRISHCRQSHRRNHQLNTRGSYHRVHQCCNDASLLPRGEAQRPGNHRSHPTTVFACARTS